MVAWEPVPHLGDLSVRTRSYPPHLRDWLRHRLRAQDNISVFSCYRILKKLARFIFGVLRFSKAMVCRPNVFSTPNLNE